MHLKLQPTARAETVLREHAGKDAAAGLTSEHTHRAVRHHCPQSNMFIWIHLQASCLLLLLNTQIKLDNAAP